MKTVGRFLMIVFLSLLGLCLLLMTISALSNPGLPQGSTVGKTLSEPDKIRLAEALRLRQTLGNNVWPGWGDADISSIAYNESYAFLVGYPDPPAGWIKVLAGLQRGGPWEMVQGDTFHGQPYWRQALPDPDTTPENFAVLVGERWAFSIQTFEWARISLREPIGQALPPILRPIFPYRLFIGLLLGGSDKYISLSAHESFHAYQGIMSP